MAVLWYVRNAFLESCMYLARTDWFAVKSDLARSRLYQADHGVRNCRCAGALQPDQTNALTWTHRKAYVLHWS